MKYIMLNHSNRTVNFLDFVQQFFTSFNLAVLSIRKARGPGNKIKSCWVFE